MGFIGKMAEGRKIFVYISCLVLFTTYMTESHGKVMPLFFGTFLRTTKSLIKINFLNDSIEFFKLRHTGTKGGINIFFKFFHTL